MTPAKSLRALLQQIDVIAPKRDKFRDALVNACMLDLTHDPGGGCDAHALAEVLRQARDPRLLYVISQGRIFSGVKSPWKWWAYFGRASQDQITIAVVANPTRYDDETPWRLVATGDVKSAEPGKNPKQKGITATVFGGPGDRQPVAYADVAEGWDSRLGVALPWRFHGARPTVRLFLNGKAVEAPIVDVGPWNTADDYWSRGTRPQAESGHDLKRRRTNKAGIDLTPPTAKALGISGRGVVDWQFV